MPEQVPDELADAELAAYLARVRADPGPSVRQLGVAAVRQAQRLRVLAAAPGPKLAAVEDLTAGLRQVPARLYRPALEPRPLVVFLHGGTWVIGDLDSHDRTCRRLAARAGVAVLAVDFRRPPEHKWPAAVDDAVDVVRWAVIEAAGLAETVRAAGPVAVAGDSSGGNLAALACLRLRDEGGPLPAAQILVTPNTDLTLSQPSARDKATGWGLDADDVAWGAELWVPGPSWLADPGVSPLYAADLSGLPPAVVVTAEHDPLRDEGDAYAARLAAAGVPVLHRVEAGMIHGFLSMERISPAAAAAGDRLFADVARVLAAGVTGTGPAPSGRPGGG
jgi:acetyl esterase